MHIHSSSQNRRTNQALSSQITSGLYVGPSIMASQSFLQTTIFSDKKLSTWILLHLLDLHVRQISTLIFLSFPPLVDMPPPHARNRACFTLPGTGMLSSWSALRGGKGGLRTWQSHRLVRFSSRKSTTDIMATTLHMNDVRLGNRPNLAESSPAGTYSWLLNPRNEDA